MKPFDFVHLALFALGGEVRGKTSLQKKVYFLGKLTNRLEELGYRPHFYGPYSDDVALAVEDLKAVGFLDQNIVTASRVGERGFERRRYDYRLTDAGRRIARAKADSDPELWSGLEKAAARLQAAGDLDYMKLSIAAKTYFLLGPETGRPTEDEVSRLASCFGWSVTPEETRAAARYLEQLGLVKLAHQ